MVVGEVATSTQVLVIGGGPGGYVAALHAAALGRSVVLVERARLGGTCLNEGCIPSKALIQAAETAALAPHAARWGVDMTANVDMARVQARIADVVKGLSKGVGTLLETAGVSVLHGTARFSNPRRVAVSCDGRVEHVEFDQAILATGSRPLELRDLPFDGERVIDAGLALALDRVPSRMAVIGGCDTGVELASAFAKLGSHVTLAEEADRLLPSMDVSLGRAIGKHLSALGVELLLGAGPVDPALFDAVVVAAGRRPNTDELGLDAAGVEVDADGFVRVDAGRRASRTALAVGDITPGPALAHKATAEAAVAALNAAGEKASFDPACIPQVVWSDPQVVTVGLTAAQLGSDARAFRFPLGASARAVMMGRTDGWVEVVTDATDGAVLGVHMVGPGVAELAGEAALAVEMGVSIDDVALTIHPHPTLSEALVEAALGVAGRPLHVRAHGADEK